MNVKRLKQVAALIAKHPRQFNMDWWFHSENAVGKKAGGCGTAACIGGWAVFLKRKEKKLGTLSKQFDGVGFVSDSIITEAGKFLDLEIWQRVNLFDVQFWPEPFRLAYEQAPTARAAAQVAVKRIAHFIKTEGKE